MKAAVIAAVCAAAVAAAGAQRAGTEARSADMNGIAERYVKLVLALGQHDADYVDAYYGPPEWKTESEGPRATLDELAARTRNLRASVEGLTIPDAGLEALRHRYLARQLDAIAARIRMLKGERLSFDEESRALYDAVAPQLPEAHFQKVLDALGALLPDEGSVLSRYEAYRHAFVIPREKHDAVFTAAIEGCRERTKTHIELPAQERFTLEYVTGKPWSGYNWYQGDYRSLIQMNVDLPIFIDRALDLACHEGYPGHHVYNALLEKHLVRDRGWMEFSVYPLFSPQSLIAEGTANYGIEVAFPGLERIAFEKTVLFPAAGLDASKADAYYKVQELVERLSYAGNEAARRYLNGEIDAAAAAAWLERYALMGGERAAQRVRFFDKYRSYVINYNLGKDLVREYIESRPGVAGSQARRWEEFETLLSSPRLPSTLR